MNARRARRAVGAAVLVSLAPLVSGAGTQADPLIEALRLGVTVTRDYQPAACQERYIAHLRDLYPGHPALPDLIADVRMREVVCGSTDSPERVVEATRQRSYRGPPGWESYPLDGVQVGSYAVSAVEGYVIHLLERGDRTEVFLRAEPAPE